MKKTPILAAGIIVGLPMIFTASAFAVTYGIETTGKDTVVSDVSLNVEDRACGLYDTYGVTGGVASDVTIDVNSTGPNAGGYGASFDGFSSGIEGIGSIDGSIKISAGGVNGVEATGIIFRNAKQADGAGINGQISVSISEASSDQYTWAQGVYVFSGSSIGDIGASAVIHASNRSSSGGAIGLGVWDCPIGTIYGTIIAEANGSAKAISMTSGSGDLYVAGNAHIEAHSFNMWGSTAVERSGGSLSVYGDNVGTQTFKGDFFTLYIDSGRALPAGNMGISFVRGKFVFDNHDVSTRFATADYNSNIIFSAGVRADFVKSAIFSAGNISLGADFVFHAKSLSDYTNMESQIYDTVYIEDTAAFLMMLDKAFTANVGDYLDLLFGEGIVDGIFSEDNVTVAYDAGLRNLIYGVDFIVEHNPESEVYGRIIFLRDIVVPEASSYAAIFGFIALFLALRKRK